MSRTLMLACLAIASAAAGCDDVAPDGTGLVVEVLADQPRSPDLGVSLAVHARGGTGVYVSVELGTFLATAGGTGQPPVAATARCIPSGSAQPRVSFELSVRPAAEEALLYAALYAANDCTGELIQSRLVAVRPPAVNPVPPDAGAAALGVP
jgi:hypothetical protein